jgi:serpin B
MKRNRVRHLAMSVAVAVVAGGACSGEGTVAPVIDRLPRQLTVAEQTIIRNTNVFGFDLLGRVRGRDAGPNVFLSPLSAGMALGMTMNGAAGETLVAMREGLRFGELTDTEVNESFRGLLDVLLDLDPRVGLRIGNSIWARQGIPFEQAFYGTADEYYDAEVQALDFADPAAVDVINAWARDATAGKIERVLNEIDPEHIMFLLNAIWFKGQWTRQFDPADTRPAPFTRADGSTVNVPMMYLPEGPVRTIYREAYQAVELPYGGRAWSMVIALPGEGRTLDDLVSDLNETMWNDLVAGLDSAELEVRMPRFRLEYETLLNRPLQDMGMRIAFSRSADFTRLTPLARVQAVCIHFVKQNTFVEVNEEGTQAAAVTTVGIGTDSAPLPFNVDRPFLFAIRERLSGVVLFIGTIGDPAVTKSSPAGDPGPVCPRLDELGTG